MEASKVLNGIKEGLARDYKLIGAVTFDYEMYVQIDNARNGMSAGVTCLLILLDPDTLKATVVKDAPFVPITIIKDKEKIADLLFSKI